MQHGAPPGELTAEVEALVKTADVAYLETEIPLAVYQSLEGVDHIAQIVRAMKEFSHPGAVEKPPTDLNRAVGNVIQVSRSEWKDVAELTTDFDPDLH
jgi:hypothetical protein